MQPRREATGAEMLVDSLIAEGVDTIFGLPGLQLDYIFDALYHRPNEVRVIHTRHEQAAAYLAFGYAQVSGRVGTCLVVPGAGVLNATAALSTAYACNAPVLCITSQIPSAYIEGGLGFLHEIPNQAGMLASVSKWQGRISAPAEAPAVVGEAFHQLNSGRRRPVIVEIPPDIAAARASPPHHTPRPPKAKLPAPNSEAIARAAALLGRASNPAIFVGSGVFGAEEELRTLAELLQAPVIMSEHGLGALDIRHPLAQTMQIGNDLWPRIDVALAIGTRFFHPIVEWGHDEAISLIRIDIDPLQSVTAWPPDVHIVADARDALTSLLSHFRTAHERRENRQSEFERIKKAKEDELAKILAPQQAYTKAIRDTLPEDGIVCFDVTQLHFYSWWGFPAYRARTVIQPGYQGTLGYGYPTALGAKIAAPNRAVAYVGGDGGFMFNCQELATAMRFDIGVVVIMFNNNAFGNVRRIQREMFEGHLIASDLYNPDFRKFVESFRMQYWQVDNAQSLARVLRAAFATGKPGFIEVTVEEDFPNPFPHMFWRKVRGK